MRKVVFHSKAFDHFNQWLKEDKKISRKIIELIYDIDRSPFSGLGKPESLKYELSGMWSRRITTEHRLVYEITSDEIIIISCKYHYSK